jgi:hypothetical protein
LVGAAAVPGAVLLGAPPAEAVPPFLVEDDTVREFSNVVYIGDSTSNGSRANLRKQLADTTLGPYRFDIGPGRAMIRPGRTMYSGLEAVRRSRTAGFTPAVYVVALGANDLRYGISTPKVAAQTFDTFMSAIDPSCTVGFTNMYATVPSLCWKYNRYLEQAASRWPNIHIIDWAAVAKRHRNWHKADGFHMNLNGSHQRNTFMIQSMIDTCKLHATLHPGG